MSAKPHTSASQCISASDAQLPRQAQCINLPISKWLVDMLGCLLTCSGLVFVLCVGGIRTPRATDSWASGLPSCDTACPETLFSTSHLISFITTGLRDYLFCCVISLALRD